MISLFLVGRKQQLYNNESWRCYWKDVFTRIQNHKSSGVLHISWFWPHWKCPDFWQKFLSGQYQNFYTRSVCTILDDNIFREVINHFISWWHLRFSLFKREIESWNLDLMEYHKKNPKISSKMLFLYIHTTLCQNVSLQR